MRASWIGRRDRPVGCLLVPLERERFAVGVVEEERSVAAAAADSCGASPSAPSQRVRPPSKRTLKRLRVARPERLGRGHRLLVVDVPVVARPHEARGRERAHRDLTLGQELGQRQPEPGREVAHVHRRDEHEPEARPGEREHRPLREVEVPGRAQELRRVVDGIGELGAVGRPHQLVLQVLERVDQRVERRVPPDRGERGEHRALGRLRHPGAQSLRAVRPVARIVRFEGGQLDRLLHLARDRGKGPRRRRRELHRPWEVVHEAEHTRRYGASSASRDSSAPAAAARSNAP